MAALAKLLGDTLLTKDGEKSTSEALDGTTAVGIYFSAHWCPPCRGFTPKLAEIYETMKAAGKKFEIVFVSSDREQAAFEEYYNEQPWLALPYGARDLKGKLSKKYKVQGIPTLVIVDSATGETITSDGRSAVMGDPKGDKFPWKPPTIWEALGDEVLDGSGDDVDVADLRGEGKVIGLYFSAHWCPPCKAFTPKLVETYKAVKAAGKSFEVIFVSSDRQMGEFQSYFGTMPWLAIPMGDPRKETLSTKFGVEGIPTFVLIDGATGATINANARGAVMNDPNGLEFPWSPKAVGDLASPDGINEETSLLVMLEGCTSEAKEAALAAVTAVAEKAKAAGEELLFFAATSEEGATPQVRKLTKQGEPTKLPQLLLLDIPDEGGFYVNEPAELTEASVRAFLDAYKGGQLTRQQLG